MVTPSGITFTYISHVDENRFDAASAALDKALLRQIGLPEDVDIRLFENSVLTIINKVSTLINNFTLSNAIWIIQSIIDDVTALWDNMESVLSEKISRDDFISRTIIYAYRKQDPDLPFLVEPFESMVEKIILSMVPTIVAQADKGLEPLIASWVQKLVKFFT